MKDLKEVERNIEPITIKTVKVHVVWESPGRDFEFMCSTDFLAQALPIETLEEMKVVMSVQLQEFTRTISSWIARGEV